MTASERSIVTKPDEFSEAEMVLQEMIGPVQGTKPTHKLILGSKKKRNEDNGVPHPEQISELHQEGAGQQNWLF